jgi:hypothetical protein
VARAAAMGFTSADWPAALRRSAAGSSVAGAGPIDGSAAVGPTAAGSPVDRAWAVNRPAVSGIAGMPAAPARIGLRPLLWRRLIGWRRLR